MRAHGGKVQRYLSKGVTHIVVVNGGSVTAACTPGAPGLTALSPRGGRRGGVDGVGDFPALEGGRAIGGGGSLGTGSSTQGSIGAATAAAAGSILARAGAGGGGGGWPAVGRGGRAPPPVSVSDLLAALHGAAVEAVAAAVSEVGSGAKASVGLSAARPGAEAAVGRLGDDARSAVAVRRLMAHLRKRLALIPGYPGSVVGGGDKRPAVTDAEAGAMGAGAGTREAGAAAGPSVGVGSDPKLAANGDSNSKPGVPPPRPLHLVSALWILDSEQTLGSPKPRLMNEADYPAPVRGLLARHTSAAAAPPHSDAGEAASGQLLAASVGAEAGAAGRATLDALQLDTQGDDGWGLGQGAAASQLPSSQWQGPGLGLGSQAVWGGAPPQSQVTLMGGTQSQWVGPGGLGQAAGGQGKRLGQSAVRRRQMLFGSQAPPRPPMPSQAVGLSQFGVEKGRAREAAVGAVGARGHGAEGGGGGGANTLGFDGGQGLGLGPGDMVVSERAASPPEPWDWSLYCGSDEATAGESELEEGRDTKSGKYNGEGV